MRRDDEAEYSGVVAELLHEIEPLDHELDWLESGPLLRTAMGFGLDTGVARTLNRHHRQQLKKRINDARFAYWRAWMELVVPILSLLVAIFALLRSQSACPN